MIREYLNSEKCNGAVCPSHCKTVDYRGVDYTHTTFIAEIHALELHISFPGTSRTHPLSLPEVMYALVLFTSHVLNQNKNITWHDVVVITFFFGKAFITVLWTRVNVVSKQCSIWQTAKLYHSLLYTMEYDNKDMS